jgi:hypothetical protein
MRGNTSEQEESIYMKNQGEDEITTNEIRMRTQWSLCGKYDMMAVDKRRLADSSKEATRRFNKGT